MVNKVPSEASFDAKVSIIRATFRIGEDPFDLSFFRTYREKASTPTVRAGGCRLLQLPRFSLIVETVTGDRPYRAGVHALTAEFTLHGPVEVRVDGCLDSSLRK